MGEPECTIKPQSMILKKRTSNYTYSVHPCTQAVAVTVPLYRRSLPQISPYLTPVN